MFDKITGFSAGFDHESGGFLLTAWKHQAGHFASGVDCAPRASADGVIKWEVIGSVYEKQAIVDGLSETRRDVPAYSLAVVAAEMRRIMERKAKDAHVAAQIAQAKAA